MADERKLVHDESQGDIVIYQTEDGDTKIDVRFVDETVWLTQQQMAEVFQSSHTNIVEQYSAHLRGGRAGRSLNLSEIPTGSHRRKQTGHKRDSVL